MEHTYTNLVVENRDDGVAVLTFNQPDRLNAFDTEMHQDVEEAFVALADDEGVKVVVVTGAGKAFSAGGDLKQLVSTHGTVEGWKQIATGMHSVKRIVDNILSCRKPTIAAVNGDAVGLGAIIALCCDLQIMSETARLGDTHVRVGLVAGDGGTVMWPLLLGPNRAKDFLMRGRLVKGVEAERVGLVTQCAPPEQTLARALELAQELAGLPSMAVQLTKVLVNKGIKDQMNLMMDASIAYEYLTMVSHDHKEAAEAFLEKRKGVFVGY